MGLGVLNDTKLPHVPGTSTLNTLHEAASTPQYAHLKRSKDGTILVPQPSDNPNDPLNWPLRRRDFITGVLCLLSVIASTLSPLLAANTLLLLLYFEKSYTQIALLTGYHLLGVGVSGFIFVASARVFGKRHLYLLGTVIIIVSSAWGGASNTSNLSQESAYKSLLAARFFQGVGLAPFEALVNASVGDLYFVHERGKRMALSNLSLFGGAFFTPVIAGKISGSLGWWWTFYLVAIFAAAMLPLVIFFVPETAFVRDDRFNTDTSMTNEGDFHKEGEETRSVQEAPAPPKFFSKQSLRVFTGRKTNDSFFKLLILPFPLFFQPAILWACLIQGAMIGWTVLLGVVLAGVTLLPPLTFSEVKVGYMYAGAFIGALLGFALSGVLSDTCVRFMSKKNGGVYEPEFRLILVFPQLLFGCAGLYGYGIVAQDIARYGWFWLDFFFALEVIGMVLGAVASALYIVDAHRDVAVEGFTCLLVFKNIFSFGLTFGAFNWFAEIDVQPVFMVIASIQVAICCSTIPMYMLGKRNRSFFARHDMLKIIDQFLGACRTLWLSISRALGRRPSREA